MKILLTGFEPFNESPINPSEQVVNALVGVEIPNVSLETAILPVDVQRSPQVLLQAFEAAQPDAVLCLGQASQRSVISIERIAINLLDFRIPDNDGNQISDQPIIPDGPDAYFTTLLVRAILDELRINGIPTQLSLSAGAYLCNQVIYVLLHHLRTQNVNIPAGFIHLPDLPEQAARHESPSPSMCLETMIRAINLVVRLIAKDKA